MFVIAIVYYTDLYYGVCKTGKGFFFFTTNRDRALKHLNRIKEKGELSKIGLKKKKRISKKK